VFPPAEYPVPDTSLVTEYAVVVESNVADEVYNAILNVSAVLALLATFVVLKLWPPLRSSTLNDVHIA